MSRFGYKRAKLALRIRIIKALCEAQFDLNARFKLNINKLEAGTLRLQPVSHSLKRDNFLPSFGYEQIVLSRLGKTSLATATGSKSTPRRMCESTEKTSMTRPGNLWLPTGLSSFHGKSVILNLQPTKMSGLYSPNLSLSAKG